MADPEEDFSSLPLPDRFGHKVWKVRKQAYEDAAKQFKSTPDERDPAFRPFLHDPGLWKAAVADSNVAAQQEAIAALCSFLEYGGREACLRTRGGSIGPIVEKGLPSTRAAIKTSSLEAILLYIELDVADPVVEEVLPVLAAKQPKVIAATLTALTAVFYNYGCKIVDPKPVLKALPKAFGHADKNVRAEATKLAVELYRWLREAMKPMLWGDLKPTQQAELEAQFEAIKAANEPLHQQRLLRSQKAAKMAAEAAGIPDDIAEEGGGANEEGTADVDAFDLAEPQDVLRSVPANFHDNLASSKWKDRKEAVEALYAVINVPRIKDGDFNEINRGLAKCMKDANIAVVTQAAQCVEVLARGLRKAYGKHRTTVMQPMLERLKEKKQSVSDAIGAALDQVFLATDLSECLEDIIAFLAHKNPQVKEGTMKFLVRCLCTTRTVPSKSEISSIVESAKKLLSESSEGLRSGGAEVLGTIMRIIGERAMNPHIDGLDEIRKSKIKEFFETAEVKAKDKPKPAPAPVTRAPPKKGVNGTKKTGPSPLKKSGAAPPLRDESHAFQSTSRPSSKLGMPRPGAAGATGGMKAPQKRTLPGLGPVSPRRPIAQAAPVEPTYDDDPLPPTTPAAKSRMGFARGGLASRSLAKPSASVASALPPAPASPTPMSGLTALERSELEELRISNDQLLRQLDEARHERSKLMSEVQELKNQNAGLIEDHTRDVLSIKAKETQLVRARSDAEAAEQTNERLRRELDRLKRALGKAEAVAAITNGSTSGMASPDLVSPTHDEAGIYRDGGYSSGLGRQRMSFASTLSEEKENGELLSSGGGVGSGLGVSSAVASAYPRTKMSPEIRYSGSVSTSGRGSPARSFRRELTVEDTGGGGYGGYNGNVAAGNASNSAPAGGQESWKRAAEVTNQLKARIELMKAKQGARRG